MLAVRGEREIRLGREKLRGEEERGGEKGGERGREILNSWKRPSCCHKALMQHVQAGVQQKVLPIEKCFFLYESCVRYNLFSHWTSLHAVHERVLVHHCHRLTKFIWGRELPRTHGHVENTRRKSVGGHSRKS